MKKPKLNRQSFIIGLFIGILITIVSFFFYYNLLSISIILSGVLSTLTVIGIGAIVSIIAFFRDSILKIIPFLTQSKIKLEIGEPEFIAKGFDHSSTAYQLKIPIVNKGRPICPIFQEVDIEIKDIEGNNPNLVKLTRNVNDSVEITMQEEPWKDTDYLLIDKSGKTERDGLELDEPHLIYYPYENIMPNITGKKFDSAFNYSEYLLDLQYKQYSFEIILRYKLKINDVINVQEKKEKWNIKPPFATFFTTTKEPELLAFKQQTYSLKNSIGACENNLANKEKELENLKVVKSEILKKEEEIKRLAEENNKLNAEIKRKEESFEDQINMINNKLHVCEEELKKSPRTKTIVL